MAKCALPAPLELELELRRGGHSTPRGSSRSPALASSTAAPALQAHQVLAIDHDITPQQYELPLLVGELYDLTILPPDACRSLADAWCKHSSACIRKLGKLVAPLRDAAEAAKHAADGGAAHSSGSGSDTDGGDEGDDGEP
jgi:hypothetical protein